MINIPKGTKDVLPGEVYKWHFVEEKIREITRIFGFKEIRTPTFEYTELFSRSAGDTSDIVSKQMYTFEDKAGRSVTLKPEGTAGVVRSFVENSLDNGPRPIKLFYIAPIFRYERPQTGRLREHHQFGVELFGSDSPYADCEVIILAKHILDALNAGGTTLCLNSIGCVSCRKGFSEALREYFEGKEEELCPVCRERLRKNPMRILDCKNPECALLARKSPKILDYLCPECRGKHEKLKELLACAGIKFEINPDIVRGLDYYTGTVFEFVSDSIGVKGTVCGGGRYDNLASDIGGKNTPGVGFGMGLERLISVMESEGAAFGGGEFPLLYIASADEESRKPALLLTNELRKSGVSCGCDLAERSLKAQMKFADRQNYRYAAIIGENELRTGIVAVKDLRDKTVSEVPTENLAAFFSDKLRDDEE